MAQYLDDLENYDGMENTNSCYLDGRYFNLVFKNYPGLLSNPLHIDIRSMGIKSANRNDKKEIPFIHMRDNNIESLNTETPGILRLVISSPETRHSNLLILDYNNEKIYRFEPLGKTAPYYEQVNDLLSSYFTNFFPFDLEVADLEFSEILDEKNPQCKKSGFCVAYNILFAYSYLKQTDFDPSDIRKFAKLIETKYGPLPNNDGQGAEIEYGPQSYYNRGGYHHGGYGRGYGGYGGGYGLYPPIIGGFGYPAYGYGVPGYGYPAYGYGYPAYGYGYPGYGYGNTGVVLGSLLGGALGAAVSGL